MGFADAVVVGVLVRRMAHRPVAARQVAADIRLVCGQLAGVCGDLVLLSLDLRLECVLREADLAAAPPDGTQHRRAVPRKIQDKEKRLIYNR